MNLIALILFLVILFVFLCLCVYLWIQFVGWHSSDKKISSSSSQFEKISAEACEDISAEACEDSSSLDLSCENKTRNDLLKKIVEILFCANEDKMEKYYELTKTDIFKKYVSSKNLFDKKIKCSDFINIFLPESQNNECDIIKIISKVQYGLKNRCFSKIFKQYIQSLGKNDFETEKDMLHKTKSKFSNISDSQDLINILAEKTKILKHSFLGTDDSILIQSTVNNFKCKDINDQYMGLGNILLLFEVIEDVLKISGLKEFMKFYMFLTKKDFVFTKNAKKTKNILKNLLLFLNSAVVSNFIIVFFNSITQKKLYPLEKQIIIEEYAKSYEHVSFFKSMRDNPGMRISERKIGYAISRFWMMLIFLWMFMKGSSETANIDRWNFIKKIFNRNEKFNPFAHPKTLYDEDFMIFINEIIDLLIKILKLIILILKLEMDIKNENVIEINDLIIEICDKIDNHELFGVIFRDIFDFC